MHSDQELPVVVPDYVLFDFLESHGDVPSARWGHTAVVIDQSLFVYGGEGSQSYGDLQLFQPENGQWHNVQTSGVDSPPAINGHAACSVGSQMFLYGGRQGRKFFHGLYRFCAESMSWQRCQNGSTTPPALAAHTLTAVGQHGILCFGGHGKKVYNTVHKLDHTTCLWQQFKTIGVPPCPRHGHTAVWDSSDSLIVFGGISSTSQCLADVHVLSLSTGFWSSPQCTGDIPRARANHAAVMWGPNLMLVFGGCDPRAAGRFMNDVFCLDTVSFTWHCLNAVGTPPAPRYWHSMVILQGKAVVYGGSNASRSFDRLFSISSDWTREFETVAGELERMSAGSNGRMTAPSANHIRLQLDGMLAQRSSAEAFQAEVSRHHQTQSLLDEESSRLRCAKSEILQLQLLQDEQQARHQRQKGLLEEELGRLRQELHQSSRTVQQSKDSNEELRQVLEQSEEQCASLRHNKDTFLALQQQHQNLQSAHHQLQQDLTAARSDLSAVQHNAQLQASYDAKLPKVINVQAASNILDSCNDDDISVHSARAQQMPVNQTGHCNGLAKVSADDTKGHDSLRMQQLAEQITEFSLQQELLSTCATPLLYSLEDTLQHALCNVQHVARKKTMHETSQAKLLLKQMEQRIEEQKACPLCMDADSDVVLNCGHQFCEQCCAAVRDCPFCRTCVSMRIKMFRS